MFKRAFTLIELIIVIAVAGAIFAFSAPYAMNFYHNQLTEEARSNIIDAMQQAKHNAALQKNDSSFGVYINQVAGQYIIYQGSSYDERVISQDLVFPLIDGVTFDGPTDIVFAKGTGKPAETGILAVNYGIFSKGILIETVGSISKTTTTGQGTAGDTTTPHTVTYNGNTNTGGSVPVDSDTYTNGLTVTVLDNTGSLTKTGYTFGSWNTRSDGQGPERLPNSTFTMGSQSLTLYAKWTPNINTITFEGNGNTSGATASQTIASDATANLYTNGFTRTGYTFVNWNTAANGSGTPYNNGAGYTIGTADVTLYAIWSASINTITFDGNGSDGGSTASQTIATGASASLRANGFTRAGYVFAGWSTTYNGSVEYNNSASYPMGTEPTVTLYAKWTAVITFNGNGNTGGVMSDQIIASGATSTLSSNIFTKTGYTFANWNTAANGSGTSYANQAVYTMGNEGVVLYARWTANINTLSFNGNNSTSGSTDSQTIATDASANLNANGFTRTGYTFANWNTAANGSGTNYAAGASYTMGTANITLYAKWTGDNNTLTFDGNGNTGGSTAAQTIASGVTTTLNNNGFTKSNYTFNGWNTLANGAGTSYSNQANYTMGVSNTTLYAKWTRNADQCTSGPTDIDCWSVASSSAIWGPSVVANTISPVNGLANTNILKDLSGAYPAADYCANLTQDDFPAGTWYLPSKNEIAEVMAQFIINYNLGDTTWGGFVNNALYLSSTEFICDGFCFYSQANGVYAGYYSNVSGVTYKYESRTARCLRRGTYVPTSYTVTFDSQGGSSVSPTSGVITGDYITLPTPPTKNGFSFYSWNTQANGNGTTFTNTTPVTGNITLYAVWGDIFTYAVTYYGNSNTSGAVPSPQTKIENVSLILQTNSGSLARTGYTFAGWNTAANGSGTNYLVGANYEANAVLNLYAKWTGNNNTLTFDGNGATGGSTASLVIASGASASLRANGFTRTGYNFDNWNTSADGSGTNYAVGQSYTMGIADITLYAKWDIPGICSISGDGSDPDCWSSSSYNGGGYVKWSTELVNTGASSTTNGAANTAQIMTYSTGSNYPAAKACSILTEGGVPAGTWFLPAIQQLVDASKNPTAFAGFYPNKYFWASTEKTQQPDRSAQLMSSYNGSLANTTKTETTYLARCLR